MNFPRNFPEINQRINFNGIDPRNYLNWHCFGIPSKGISLWRIFTHVPLKGFRSDSTLCVPGNSWVLPPTFSIKLIIFNYFLNASRSWFFFDEFFIPPIVQTPLAYRTSQLIKAIKFKPPRWENFRCSFTNFHEHIRALTAFHHHRTVESKQTKPKRFTSVGDVVKKLLNSDTH